VVEGLGESAEDDDLSELEKADNQGIFAKFCRGLDNALDERSVRLPQG
jgi:hypothetical protein